MRKFSVLEVLYPIGMYYLVSGFVFFALNILLGESQEIYMLKQLISSGATIPFLISLWKQEMYVEKVVYGTEKQPIGQLVLQIVLVGISAGTLGIALNNFIAMTPLMEVSSGFQNANENFFAGGFLVEILASCIIVPIAEELLFRGIILKKTSMMAGECMGIFCSSLLFGIIHMNLVQFIYATMIGAFLAIVVVKTGKLYLAMIGHGIANFIAIIRVETGILDFSYKANMPGIGFSLMMAIVSAAAAVVLLKQCGKKS